MIKIGILTFHFSENYGAVFQAYALRKYLLESGYDVEFVNYQPAYLEEGEKIQFSDFFSKVIFKKIFLKLVGLKQKYFGNVSVKEGFEDFRVKLLGVGGSTYKTKSELESSLVKFDVLICGSDQVWKPSDQVGIDPVYYLQFATESCPVKISYAPSFGTADLPNQYREQVKSLLTDFRFISVREKSGCEIVRRLVEKEVVQVPDPTFLLNDYSSIYKPYTAAEALNGKYVFCYCLRSRELIGEVANALAESDNLAIFSPDNPHRRWKEIGTTVHICPRQWLWLLANSACVVTNSFHGVALSIILRKKFIAVGLQGSKKSFNERVKNLLRELGLENRFVDKFDMDNIQNLAHSDDDLVAAQLRIEEFSSKGKTYLSESLGAL